MKLLLILELIALTEGSAPNSTGLNGERSIYQISPIALLEVNECLYKEKHEFIIMSQLNDKEVAKFVAKTYIMILKKKYKCNTMEKLIRCYNGGLSGHLRKSTLDYWQRFKNHAKLKGVDL